LVFVAEVENFLAVSIEDEQLGGRELLAVGQVDQVGGGAVVDTGQLVGRGRGFSPVGLGRIPERTRRIPDRDAVSFQRKFLS
jgi:hypothetical protein